MGGKSALRVGDEGGEALLFLETQPISFHFGFMIGLVISGSTRHDFEEKTERARRNRDVGPILFGLHDVFAANGRWPPRSLSSPVFVRCALFTPFAACNGPRRQVHSAKAGSEHDEDSL